MHAFAANSTFLPRSPKQLPSTEAMAPNTNETQAPRGHCLGECKDQWEDRDPEKQALTFLLIELNTFYGANRWDRDDRGADDGDKGRGEPSVMICGGMDEGEKVLAVKTTLPLLRRKRDPTHDRFLGSDEALRAEGTFIKNGNYFLGHKHFELLVAVEHLNTESSGFIKAIKHKEDLSTFETTPSCELLEVYSPPSRTPIIATTGQHLIDRLASTGAFSKKDWGETGWRVVIGAEGDLRRKCEVEEVYVCVAPPPNRQERLLSAMFSARLPSCPEGTGESR
ncbi:hypothetical protein PAMA_021637 [Pampus argenteus]